MKKNLSSTHGWHIHSLFKNLLVVAFLLMSISAIAQQQNTYNTGNNPDLYIEKNPDSPLVKYYMADQTNSRAFTAIEYTVLLNKGDKQNIKDEQQMRNFVTDVTADAMKFEKYMIQGVDSKSAAKRAGSQPTITPVSSQMENSKPLPATKIKTQSGNQGNAQTRMQVTPVKSKPDKK